MLASGRVHCTASVGEFGPGVTASVQHIWTAAPLWRARLADIDTRANVSVVTICKIPTSSVARLPPPTAAVNHPGGLMCEKRYEPLALPALRAKEFRVFRGEG